MRGEPETEKGGRADICGKDRDQWRKKRLPAHWSVVTAQLRAESVLKFVISRVVGVCWAGKVRLLFSVPFQSVLGFLNGPRSLGPPEAELC